MWEERREREGRDTLLDRSLLKIEQLRAGLTTLMMQQLILLGTFFVLPVYLQVVLGLDAFETGKRLFPMSVTMFVAAMAGPRLAAGLAPKRVAQAGLVALVIASVVLLGTIDVELNETGFAHRARALRRRRRPAALPARQRDHVVGRPGQDQRGRRPPGDRAEPRRLARHRADRRGADRGADERVRRAGGAEPGGAAAGARARRRARREGHPGRAGRRRRAGGARRRASPPTRRRRSPTTTATPSSTGSSARSARSRSSRCSRSGSRAGCRDVPWAGRRLSRLLAIRRE